MALNHSKTVVYVIVRRDLKPTAIPAQACHAALEAGIHLNQESSYNASVVVLQVANEQKLIAAQEKLDKKGIKTYLFWERSMQSYTALASEVLYTEEQRRAFKKFQLLKQEHLSEA